MKVIRSTPDSGKAFQKVINDLITNKKVSKVGWFQDAKYANGTPVAYVATIQEFGSPKNKIPPRPFVRPTIQEKTEYWKKIAVNESKKILKGNRSVDEAIGILGQVAEGDIREKITKIKEPELAESTKRNRRYKRANKKQSRYPEKPLVDQGIMLDSLTSRVETGDVG